MKHFLLLSLCLLSLHLAKAQTQAVRGTILDAQSETPLVGANIVLLDSTIFIGSSTDENGTFELNAVPLGRQTFIVSYLGYENVIIPNVLVTKGKENVLNVKMQEQFNRLDEVVVVGKVQKDKAVNELATISARQFNMEEVRRYSGGRGDVARLVGNFAGVATANDSRNDIVVRGNAPTGVLWRLNGVPIPSPNHFSTLGTTGGPVSALNTNLIGNSDFLTSAFPSEYGDALAGVFDISFRKGNTDKNEFTLQLGAFTGLEAMAEGPLRKGKGSFVVAYRHSFVEVAQAAGLSVGTSALPLYKDLSFNVDLGHTKLGQLSMFGILANSSIDFLAANLDTSEIFVNPNENSYSSSSLATVGIRHNVLLNDRSYIRTVISGNYSRAGFKVDDVVTRPEFPDKVLDIDDINQGLRIHSFYHTKLNTRMTMRFGVQHAVSNLDAFAQSKQYNIDFDGDGKFDWLSIRDLNSTIQLSELYAHTQWRWTEKLTLNAGLHSQYQDISNRFVVEPRLAMNYQIFPKHRLSLGWGVHHQTLPIPVLVQEIRQTDGKYTSPNKKLPFSKSLHYVLGYDFNPADNWRIKAEVYLQDLSNIAVDTFSSSFSLLNLGADFGFPLINTLAANGTGRNNGVELTIEKFFNKGYYGLFTASLYEAKYKGSDGIQRNTAFNGRYVANFLAGKEFYFGKNRRNTFTLDTKITAAGGRPYTPIDLEASKAAGREIRQVDKAFSLRQEDYFRWDVKIGFRQNARKRNMTQTFFLDFQNVTNRQNVFAQTYNTATEKVGTLYQIGFFPDILYRVEF